MLTNRKKLMDRTINVRDASLCVIATEGEKTEKQYFEMFLNPRVKVHVLPTEDGKSGAKHVLSRLDEFRNTYSDPEFGGEDRFWLMIDIDHNRAEQLSLLCQQAIQKGFELAISLSLCVRFFVSFFATLRLCGS